MTGVRSTSSLFPGGGSFTVDGVHSDYFGMYYSNWTYDVIPSIRSAMVDIPGRRGKRDNGSELSSRLLTMDLRTVDYISAQQRWDNMSRWAAAMNPETGPHAIEFVDERPGWYLLVQPAGGSASPSLVVAEWSQSFECADPHWYSTTPMSPTMVLNYGDTQVLYNPGNTYCDVVYLVDSVAPASLTNPTLVIHFADRFTLGGTIGPGEQWAVDTATKMVYRNGQSDIANWSNAFPVLPGVQAGYDNAVAGGPGQGYYVTHGGGTGAMYVQFNYTPRLL